MRFLTKKIIIGIILAVIVVGLSATVFFIIRSLNTPDTPGEISVDENSSYTIIYGNNTPTGGKMAYTFKNKLGYICKNFEMLSDETEERDLEILLGDTNRPLSGELKNKAHASAKADSHVYGFAYKDGKLAIYVSNSGKALDKAMEKFTESYVKDSKLVFPGDLFAVYEYTRAEEEADELAELQRIEEEKKAERAKKAEEYKKLCATFTNSEFGSITETLGDTYQAPPFSPTKGEHPRLLINSELLEELRLVIETEECSRAKSEFFALANTESDGKLPPATVHSTGRIGDHNYDNKLLGVIQAKALAYLLTGEEYYGYSAILAMKNFILTLDIKWIHSDQCREFGYVMYMAALVYDWCYPLLTASDKHQLIAGIENYICRGTTENTVDSTYGGIKMEVGFPPSKDHAVTGHGTEMQILRDYLSFAVAIFDEYPDWWEYIGGRYYEEFVPVRNAFYVGGAYPQGTAIYAPWRHMGDLWAAWIVTAFGAPSPYEGNVSAVVRYLFAHETYDNAFFNTGDGKQTKIPTTAVYCALISSALYNDSALRAWAKHLGSGFSSFSYGVASITPSEMLILSAFGTKTAEDRYDGFDTVYSNPYPWGQTIVRQSYNSAEAAVVFMKIGERSTGNHDHQASGSFQIYYKGLLTSDGGVYSDYGSDHHYYYHQATISHNSLLVYNPALAKTNGGWYSGGQKRQPQALTLDQWESGTFETGRVIGSASGYAKDGKTPTFAYLAGDITKAYDSVTVDYVGRRMLTVYTGAEKIPMMMVVYDGIISDDASFKKTFLLQAPTEPTVSSDGTVTVINGDGKQVLVPVIGADDVTAVGGEDKQYYVNDKQCLPTKAVENAEWGRVEISHSGTKQSEFLNLIYVSDKDETATVTPISIQTEGDLSGLCAADVCAVFVKDSERTKESFSFRSFGEGKMRYYISGVYEGEWLVTVNGSQPFKVTADAEGGLLSFEGEAGDITVTPSDGIIPNGAYEISYVMNGGTLTDAPKYYFPGETITLPTPTSHGNSIFVGWYTDSSFENRITEISAASVGKLKVYAKWHTVSTVDFTSATVNSTEKNCSVGAVSFQLNQKIGASVKSESAGTETFVTWRKGENDPSLANLTNLVDTLGNENRVTFRIRLAKDTENPTFSTTFRLRGHDVGNLKSMNNTVSVFKTDNSGNVTLGNSSFVILTLTDKLTEFSVTVDFESSTMTAYDKDGNALHTTSFVPNALSGASNGLEWKNQLTDYAYNWYGGSTSSSPNSELRLGEISYYVGGFVG